MQQTVQARLDASSSAALARLVAQRGWSPSRVVREAVKALAAGESGRRSPRVRGIGRFASGVSDLGSNRKHLTGFGR